MRAAVRVMAHVFFFQAEDGIRDYKVTGVQTCALPISGWNARGEPGRRADGAAGRALLPGGLARVRPPASEEASVAGLGVPPETRVVFGFSGGTPTRLTLSAGSP